MAELRLVSSLAAFLRALRWVDKAEVLGINPQLRQEGLSDSRGTKGASKLRAEPA